MAPELEPPPFSVTEFCTQVSEAGAAMTTEGGVVLLPTVAVAVVVQPFIWLVTVREYVPAADTVGVRVFCPPVIWPPDQL